MYCDWKIFPIATRDYSCQPHIPLTDFAEPIPQTHLLMQYTNTHSHTLITTHVWKMEH